MRLTFSASSLPLIAVLALFTAACGDKGGDDDAAPGPTGPETLHAFDMNVEGFKFETYEPGDPMYHNIYFDDPANAVLSWDGEAGSDGEAGRLKLAMNFSNWNQLADIQLNLSGDDIIDGLGKIMRAKVMLESGFSTNPSCPGGSYLFLKTGAEYVWARGETINLEQTGLGVWNTVTFQIDSPSQSNSPYDPAQILALGLQFYSSGGSGCSELPAAVTAYVDTITIEDAE